MANNNKVRPKPPGKRTEGGLTKPERLQLLNDMYAKGKTQMEMALVCGVTQGQISGDLKDIRELWIKEHVLVGFDEAKSAELAKIAHLERVAWEAYEKSCGEKFNTRRVEKALKRMPTVDRVNDPGTKSRVKKLADELKQAVDSLPPEKMVPVKVVSQLEFSSSAGNPVFLDRVAWCIEMRVKILGLVKDVNVTNFINWDAVAQAAVSDPAFDPVEQRILDVK